jgi:DNA-directed RNA polymerase specialized sigma subunit
MIPFEDMVIEARAETDPEIRNRKIVQIWRTHYKLAVLVYKAFKGVDYVTMEYTDAQSYLWQGIVKCVDRWDKTKGGGAVTYAVNSAKFYVLNSCRKYREMLASFNYEIDLEAPPECQETLHALMLENYEYHNGTNYEEDEEENYFDR